MIFTAVTNKKAMLYLLPVYERTRKADDLHKIFHVNKLWTKHK